MKAIGAGTGRGDDRGAKHNRAVALLAGKGWHPGVIGIVAGRIKEKTGKPSIVIAVDETGTGKGSGRSIAGVDLGAAIIAAKDAGFLVAGGGHAMAAGLTVREDKNRCAWPNWLDERLANDVARASRGARRSSSTRLSPRAG